MSLDRLEHARAAFDREAWADAYGTFCECARQRPLEAADLDRLATAAYLVGEGAASAEARTRAHHAWLEGGDPQRAVRAVFWLLFTTFDQPGHQARVAGWMERARRLIEDLPADCAERGLLLCGAAFQTIREGDLATAQASFAEAARIGTRCGDRDLAALARHGEGRALVGLNRTTEGLAMLDEVMIAVTCGEVGPIASGVVYCSVISACLDLFDLARAQEWTAALSAWCASHSDMIAFRGACRVHRSELLQLHGTWQTALDEAERAAASSAGTSQPADAAAAFYQLGELHRLRGEFDRAENAYRRANLAGRNPEPGLALLRHAQGERAAAEAAIRRALADRRGPRARTETLRAAVEILCAVNDLAGARVAADELGAQAGQLQSPYLRAATAHALGAIALASDDANGAIPLLRDASALWRTVDAPYEIARARVLLGLAYRALKDEDGASLEFDAAHETFEQLGARLDADRVAACLGATTPVASEGLTGREVEVLRLIATGKTNRAIAADLAISEKTVARHVSNIFIKLDLSSRSAATAYAFEHKLL